MPTQFSNLTKSDGTPVRLIVRGNWDADTNTPTLVSSTGLLGDTYRVSVAGSTSLDGIASWLQDDYVYFDGSAWQKDDHNNVSGGGASALSAVLALGNTSGGTDLEVSSGDRLLVDGAVTYRASALVVGTSTDLTPVQVVANPNTGVRSQIVQFKATVLASGSGGVVDTASWLIEGVIVREFGTDTVLFPTPPTITPLYNANPVDWEVVAVADDPGKALVLRATTDGFGSGPGTAPSAGFTALVELVPADTPL